ncbi:MAG: excinuclease ABC subunit C, partial [Nanoarchaeota archaeon]|nr:excinuclease ABC subunit C [Nanoarchaeota archaeon]
EAEKEVLEEYLSRLGKFKVKLSLPQKGEKKGLVQIALKNAELQFGDNDVLLELQKNLSLPRVPRVIECFDMSNLSYDYLVGGMTRFVEGKEDKAGYRKFEIKSFKGKNDDFAAMKETVFRRYKRLKEEAKDFPDLILIDGGKGQLGAALSALKDLGLEESIPLASLAKKEEEIFLPGKEDSLHFDKNSQMMLLLRKIRDSVHTFVVAYNRKKREMRMREEKKS